MTTLKPRRPIRLAVSTLFWRLLIGFSILLEALFGLALIQKVPPGQWLIAFLFWSPPFLGVAFALAAGFTTLANLAVGLIVRPRLLAWQAPRVDESAAAFHLEPRESILAETPARMSVGRAWPTGRLVRTDRRLLFLPVSWEAEPWLVAQSRVSGIRAVQTPGSYWGLVRDLPDRLEIQAEGEPTRVFALAGARDWAVRLDEGRSATHTLTSRS
jgi:hypothetical protein